jgi:hypothetical protein
VGQDARRACDVDVVGSGENLQDGWFEVVAGKSMSTDGEAKCFAFVQRIDH